MIAARSSKLSAAHAGWALRAAATAASNWRIDALGAFEHDLGGADRVENLVGPVLAGHFPPHR